MIINLKRFIDLRWLFDDRCCIPLRRSYFGMDLIGLCPYVLLGLWDALIFGKILRFLVYLFNFCFFWTKFKRTATFFLKPSPRWSCLALPDCQSFRWGVLNSSYRKEGNKSISEPKQTLTFTKPYSEIYFLFGTKVMASLLILRGGWLGFGGGWSRWLRWPALIRVGG